MSHLLTLNVPDDMYEPLTEAAAEAGQSLEDWALARLRSHALTPEVRAAALARLLQHAVSALPASETQPALNPLDAELAEEYVNPHEARP
jgi:hypothetical protein